MNRPFLRTAVLALITCSLANIAYSNRAIAAVNWRSDLDAAKIEAAQTNRFVLIHFWTPSCGPCQELDKNVFGDPSVGPAMERDYVPVKINADAWPAIAQAFRVTKVPTEIILSPQGSVISTPPTPRTSAEYTMQLSRLAAHFRNTLTTSQASNDGLSVNRAYSNLPIASIGQTNAGAVAANQRGVNTAPRSDHAGQPNVTGRIASSAPTTAGPANGTAGGLTSQSTNGQMNRYTEIAATAGTQNSAVATVASQNTASPAAAAQTDAGSTTPTPQGAAPVGLEGYCPVTLRFAKKWVKGSPTVGIVHRGRTYLFAGEGERQQFIANPDMYSPVFNGIDPVLLIDEKQAVEGSRRFGYEYRGAVYLFSSKETMEKFGASPDVYSAGVLEAMRRLDGASGATVRR